MASNYQVGNLELRITSYANTATQSLGKMNTQLDRTRKTLKNVGIFATFGKLNYMTNMMRYYGRAVANVVQYAMDYVETLNLWQVANRENIDLADEFIAKMNKAYGVSEQTLMNYQAIFKNMLAALGDLSDAVSSQLSMQLTQMALDFSSLYNVTIERAMTVYQSILSGQVRPVRSISGMDITENTIFDLYQQAGGEKTVRQLSQIEKRLLRIAAIFDQMGASGAIGDMEKTIESASNQARVMSEQLKEVLTWTGQIILLWLNNNKVFQYINAALMTMKEIVKSIAFDLGYEEQNFLDGMITQAENADEALDEVQGKLLSFDKFEALNSTDSNVLGIDPVIEDLIANINLGMTEFQMQASKIAEEWLKLLGFEYNAETGLWEMGDGATSLLDKIKEIGQGILGWISILGLIKSPLNTLLVIFGYLYITNDELRNNINQTILALSDAFVSIGSSILNILNAILPILSPIITSIANLIVNIDKIGMLEPLLWSIFAALLAIKGIELAKSLISGITTLITKMQEFNLQCALAKTKSQILQQTWTSLAFAGVAIATGVISIIANWGEMSTTAKVLVGVVVGLTAVIAALAFAIYAAHLQWAKAISVAAGVVGAGMTVASGLAMFENGGFPEEGQLFVAREAGPEMVGSMGGRTTVANNDQIVEGISQGVYEAVVSANSQNNQQLTGNVYIDGSKVGKVVARPVYAEGVRIGVFKKA